MLENPELFKWPKITATDEQAVGNALRSSFISGTDITLKFEKELADFFGSEYALCYVNGTASLHAAMWACGVGVGDEVICQSATYWACCTAALSMGATVNFADIVSGYIPVRSTLNLFSFLKDATSYSSSDSRAVICWGSYGSGKSRLCTVVARLFLEGFKCNALQPVWKRLKERGLKKKLDELQQVLSPGETKWKKWLVVPMYGTEKTSSISTALIKSLVIAIQGEGLDPNEIIGETTYSLAAKKLEDLISEGKAYTPAEDIQFSDYIELKRALQDDMDETAYEEFNRFHKEVTSYDFAKVAFHDKSDSSELKNIYSQASEVIRKKGYGGIVVLWDEFGFEIEEMLKRDSVGTEIVEELQPFIEGPCKEKKVIFIGFTHVSISEYGTRGNLSEGHLDRIKTVEGRFTKPININLEITENEGYHLLAGFFSKSQDGEKFFSQEYSNLEDISRLMLEFNIWKDLGAERCYHDILSPCYPFHPSATIALLLLSTEIAQRERTTFYFLQNQEEYGFTGYLQETIIPDHEYIGSNELMRIFYLFDFFEEAIQTEKKDLYAQYKSAIAILPNANDIDKNILKTLLLIKVIASPSIVATDDFLSFSFVDNLSSHQSAHEVIKSLTSLAKANIIWKNAGTEIWDFVSGQGVSVEIQNKIQKESNEISTNSLTRLFFEYPILQTEIFDFIGEYQLEPSDDGIIRNVEIKILDTLTINIKDALEDVYSRNNPWRNAIIYLLVIDNAKALNEFNNSLPNLSKRNLFFLLPNKPLTIDLLEFKRLIAVLSLLEKTEQGEHTYNVLEGELTGLKNSIKNEFNNYFGNIAFIEENVKVIATGDKTKILSPSSWNTFFDEIQEEIESQYEDKIKVRCGGFNEWKFDSRWTPIKNIVSRILDFSKNKEYQKSFLGFQESSEEASIIDGVLVENEIYKFDEIESEWKFIEINKTTPIAVIKHIYKHFTTRTSRDYSSNYYDLIRPPFGILNGIIPILTALVFMDNKNRILLYEKNAQIADSKLPEALVKMAKSPKLFKSRFQELNRKERFVYSIVARNEKISFDNIIGEKFTAICEETRKLLHNWGKNLPEDVLNVASLNGFELDLLKKIKNPIYPSLTDFADSIKDLFYSGDEVCKNELTDLGTNFKATPGCDDRWRTFKLKVNAYQEDVKANVKSVLEDISGVEDIDKDGNIADIFSSNLSKETNQIVEDIIGMKFADIDTQGAPVESFVSAISKKTVGKLNNEDYHKASGALETIKKVDKNVKIREQAIKNEMEIKKKERLENAQMSIMLPNTKVINLDSSNMNNEVEINTNINEFIKLIKEEHNLSKEDTIYSLISKLYLNSEVENE